MGLRHHFAEQQFLAAHVRYGSLASFWALWPMSAFTPKADMARILGDVRFVPKADIPRCGKKLVLFDHIVSATEQQRWHVEVQRLGGLEIDDQFKLCSALGSEGRQASRP